MQNQMHDPVTHPAPRPYAPPPMPPRVVSPAVPLPANLKQLKGIQK